MAMNLKIIYKNVIKYNKKIGKGWTLGKKDDIIILLVKYRSYEKEAK